ncbi:MAG: SufS family cysteine desulfurase [Tissierellia bacterium]|nr:SufS family cysteine desulfurase [Tissierellia bacterium]
MDVEKIRGYFPYLQNEETKDLVYLDNAATSQKPKLVIDALTYYYTRLNANPNRGAYKLSYESTKAYEHVREKVADFIGAESKEQIIFTKNTSESINLVCYSYGLTNLKEGDEVLVSVLEHHSNLVNWQYVCEKTGAKLRYFYLDDSYCLDMDDFYKKLNPKTKIVAITAASNVIACQIPIKEIIDAAKKMGATTVVDGAQYTAHKKVNVKDLGCDFYAFSGHKLFSPMGVGVLYGKRELLDEMPPFLYGGDMIEYVHEDKSTFAPSPEKFEAGTQNVGAVYALGKAIDFIQEIGFEQISQREHDLILYAAEKMKALDFIEMYYPKRDVEGTNIIFNVKNVHPHDVASILDYQNVAIRSGHHCTQVLHRYLGINASCRISVAFYNTKEEIDKFIKALDLVKEMLI